MKVLLLSLLHCTPRGAQILPADGGKTQVLGAGLWSKADPGLSSVSTTLQPGLHAPLCTSVSPSVQRGSPSPGLV